MTARPETELPELPEAAAAGPIKEIFAELRGLSATPVVALIFRHLATHEGLLEEIWAGLRPLMATGRIQETAWRSAERSIPDGLVPPLGADLRHALGIGEATLPPLLSALDAYNRANPVNLLVMLTLLERVALGSKAAVPLDAPSWTPPAPIEGPLAPMLAPEAMTPEIRRLVNDIGFGDRTRLDSVVPSLLRILAGCPPLLAVVHVVLVPSLRDGSLQRRTDALRAEMQAAAGGLARHLPPLPRLAALPEVQETLRHFTHNWIPLMTIAGPALARSLRP
jgi:hypothetical protein